MPTRRETILAGGTLLSSTFAGCLDTFRTTGSVQEVEVNLWNGDDETHTLHCTLELENGIMEWESYSVDAETEKQVVITPPEDSSPVVFHGVIDDFSDHIRLRGVDDADGDICPGVSLYHKVDDDEETSLWNSQDISC